MTEFNNSIPPKVQELINHYQNLNIAGKTVNTPYYRNVKRVRAGLRSLTGKGTPEEIEEETLIYSKLRGVSLEDKNESQIREFMQSQGIGVDCSGLVAHIYDIWLKSTKKGSLRTKLIRPKESAYRRFISWLRPIEGAGANLLTSSLNCKSVKIQDVRVGDMIRMKGSRIGHHVALVIDVKNESNKVKEITYINSHAGYGDQNGIRIGKIGIKNETNELKDQDWQDKDADGKCWIMENLLKEYEDNGLRRPKFLQVQE